MKDMEAWREYNVALHIQTTHTCSEAKKRWGSNLLNSCMEIHKRHTMRKIFFFFERAFLIEMPQRQEMEIVEDFLFLGSWKSNVGTQRRLHDFLWLTMLYLPVEKVKAAVQISLWLRKNGLRSQKIIDVKVIVRC